MYVQSMAVKARSVYTQTTCERRLLRSKTLHSALLFLNLRILPLRRRPSAGLDMYRYDMSAELNMSVYMVTIIVSRFAVSRLLSQTSLHQKLKRLPTGLMVTSATSISFIYYISFFVLVKPSDFSLNAPSLFDTHSVTLDVSQT